jgi:hypothetical protein
MHSQEPQFAQKLDDPRLQGSSKYLKNKEIKEYKITKNETKSTRGIQETHIATAHMLIQ